MSVCLIIHFSFVLHSIYILYVKLTADIKLTRKRHVMEKRVGPGLKDCSKLLRLTSRKAAE